VARLLRLAFSSIGHRDARLDPVVLDLRGAGGGGVDSVLWLRNGGGKTSIINLFFSLFRPSRAEFLGSTAEGKARRIGDYVKSGDLSFVVSEWDVAPEGERAPREVRLVGQVLAWKGGQASADQSKLQRLWFSLRAGDWIAFEALPIRGLGAGLGSFEGFRDWLRAEAHARPGAEVVVTEQQRVWLDHLDKLGLDPELFRYQLEMNKREGAADEVFRFASAADFIRFLLALAFESGRADQVVGNLGELREQLIRRPILQRELGFLGQALAALEPLAAAARERAAARAERAAVLDRIAALCAAADERRAQLGGERDAMLVRAGAADERARQAGNERDKLQRWARGLELRGLELEVDEAEAARAEASDRARAATEALAAARAGEKLAELRRAHADADALREALARSALELAPLLRALGRTGAALLAALGVERQRLGSELADVEARVSLADATLRRQRAEVGELSVASGLLAGRRKALEDRLARRDRERDRLIREGWLERRETADEGMARWAAAGDGGRQRADDAEEKATEARQRLDQIAARTAQVAGDLAEQRAAAARLWADHEAAIAWRDRLAAAPLLTVIEGTEAVDLGAAGLEARVRRRAEGLDRELLARAVDGAEDRQALRVLEETGLLPPAREVDRVCQALRERGEVAHAGVSYLAENLAPDRVAALLVCDPARFGGVVVLRDSGLDAARAIGADAGLRAPVQVSRIEPEDLVPGARPDRAAVVAPSPALYDRRAAEARRAELEGLGSERARIERGLAEERRVAEALAEDLHRYVDAHGGGKLEALERAAQLADERRDLAARELAELSAEQNTVGARLAELERLVAVERKAAVRADAAHRALNHFLDEHDAAAPAARDELEEVGRSIRDTDRRLGELADLIERSERGLEGLREDRRDSRRRCDECEAEERSVSHHAGADEDDEGTDQSESEGACEPGPPPTLEPTLDQARARHRILLEEHDRRVSQDKRRWQLEQIEAALLQLGRQLSTLSAGLPAGAIAEVAALSDPAGEVAARQAGQRSADQKVAEHKASVREATRRLDEARRRRDAADLPADRPAPLTSAAAREAAEETRIAAQAAAEETQRHAQEAAGARARAVELERSAAELERVPAGLRAVVEGAALELPPATPAALPEELEVVTERAADLRRAFTAVRDAAIAAEARVRDLAERVRRLAGAAEHAELRAQYRERMKDETEELAAGAARLAAGLDERRAVIEGQLAAIERDRAILLDSLAALGDDAERFLQRTTRASVMPAGLGAWADRPYLRIDFQFPAAADERRARIEPLVDRLIDRARLDGNDLVREVVTELAGTRGFEVRILKPDAVLRPEPVPIAAITTFSRGQQLTAAILLYCTLVQMRARTRGRSTGATDAGMLLLDNPIGTCSSVPLLQLQRRIASQMRVQLVYATGVDDLEALDTLPNKIRLRNAHRDRATGDQHVTLEGQLEAVRVVERAAP